MNQELLCSWFGLLPQSWPPDHYSLLGINPGEPDLALIEKQVHIRMEIVRRYQLTYPDQVTEAMNHLAKAFSNLLDPQQKKIYDASLGIPRKSETPCPPGLTNLPPGPTPTEVGTPGNHFSTGAGTNGSNTLVAIPPPLPNPVLPNSSSTTIQSFPPFPGQATANSGVVVPPSPPGTAPLERIDPIQEVARCAIARFNLGTRNGVYNRLLLTRRLIQHWETIGKYVKFPERKLNRKSAANELDYELSVVGDLLKEFPPILGQAGQPGYQVMTLATMQLLKTFQNMDLLQRQSLSLDWYSGRNLLRSHTRFVRNRGKELRKANKFQRFLSGISSILFERIGLILVLIALVALNLAIWRTLIETWK